MFDGKEEKQNWRNSTILVINMHILLAELSLPVGLSDIISVEFSVSSRIHEKSYSDDFGCFIHVLGIEAKLLSRTK